MWGPYLDFLYNPGYFLSIAFLAPDSAFFTPDGDTRFCNASTAAGPVSVLGIGFLAPTAGLRGATGFLGAGFFIFGIVSPICLLSRAYRRRFRMNLNRHAYLHHHVA
jgi:hypothetical protein